MFEFLKKIRSAPDDEKRKIFLGTMFAFSAIFVAVWLFNVKRTIESLSTEARRPSDVSASVSASASAGQGTVSPLSTLGTELTGIKGMISDLVSEQLLFFAGKATYEKERDYPEL